MKRNITICLVLLLLVVTSFFAAKTFARYKTEASGNAEVIVAAWNVDVTKDGEAAFTGDIPTTIIENANVVSTRVAPGSKAYFDVVLDYSGTEVAIDYTVALNTASITLPTDLAITGYEVADTEAALTGTATGGTTVTGSVALEDNAAFVEGSKKYIRVYVEWTNTEANNAAHTEAGEKDLAGRTFEVPVTVTVQQKIA